MKKNRKYFLVIVLLSAILLVYFSGIVLSKKSNESKDLAAYYSFDDETANDFSGNNNNGILKKGVNFTEGISGKGAYFDGFDDFIRVNNIEINEKDDFSISYWINPYFHYNSKINRGSILWLQGKGNLKKPTYFAILHNTNENVTAFLLNSNNGHKWAYAPIQFTSQAYLPPGTSPKWIHIVGVFDYHTKNISLYADGVKIAEQHQTTKGVKGDGILWIGKVYDDYFAGVIDEVKIYKKALNDGEIKELYKENLRNNNKKDMSRYSEKEVFLVSDKNWKEVLPLIPLTTWTGSENCQKGYGTPKNVCVYSTLIYHQEENSFDADSIIHFMQQYSPNKITIVGDYPKELNNLLTSTEVGAGLKQSQIQKITKEDYLSYWRGYENVVYVENNYELALVASTYASLINAPLLIEDYNDKIDLFNKEIICVGNININCSKKYNLKELQEEYIKITNTDKIILVNPDDLILKIYGEIYPKNSPNSVRTLFNKISLSAPILASAKQEIILTTPSTDYKEISQHINDFIDEFMPYLINNPQGITNEEDVYYSSDKLYKKNLLTNKIKSTFSFIDNSDLNLIYYNDKMLFKDITLKVLDLDDYSVKIIKDTENKEIKYYNFYSDGVIYNILERNGNNNYSCSLYSYNLETEKTKFLYKYNKYCYDIKSSNNYVLDYKIEGGACYKSKTECSNDNPCSKKYCSLNGNECVDQSQCFGGKSDLCIVDLCKDSIYSLYLYNIKSNKTEKISYVVNEHNFDVGKNYAAWADNKTVFTYDLSSKSTISFKVNETINPIKVEDNYVTWLSFKGTGQNKVYSISVYDILNDKLMSIFPGGSFNYQIYNEKIIFVKKNNETYCSFTGKLCQDEKDCLQDEMCIPKENIIVYNLKSNKTEEIEIEKPSPKKVIYRDNSIYFISRTINNNSIYGYLTIISPPNAIPFREDTQNFQAEVFRALDGTEYADIYLEDRYSDLGVGRIQGITISDSSSYMSRDIFYDKLPKTNDMFFYSSSIDYMVRNTNSWTNSFNSSGYNVKCSVISIKGVETPFCSNNDEYKWSEYWKNKILVSYADHGYTNLAGIKSNEIPDLKNTVVFIDACATCSTTSQDSFCNNVIRKGGLGYFGSVSVAFAGKRIYRDTMNGIFYDNLSLGYAFSKSNSYKNEYTTMLIGDPTFTLNPEKKLLEKLSFES